MKKDELKVGMILQFKSENTTIRRGWHGHRVEVVSLTAPDRYDKDKIVVKMLTVPESRSYLDVGSTANLEPIHFERVAPDNNEQASLLLRTDD